MTTTRKRVADTALKIIQANPSGIRWADLFRAVSKELPAEKPNTVVGSLHHFRNHLPEGVVRPDRGIYAFGEGATAEPISTSKPTSFPEADFYQPFAEWLVNALEEATVAISVGGNIFKGKWGTPDVVGTFSPSETDAIKFTREVIAAEIKVDTQSLIVAFGQACAYKLFSHRVYIVVPRSSNESDLKRLDALASVIGIGLVKFDASNPDNPDFQLMVKAAKHEPDYYYTNQAMRELSANQRKGLGI